MATHNWGTNRPLRDFLFDEAHQFDFYQAVRLLEALQPGRPPVGENIDPADDLVRFKSKVSFGFPATDVDSMRRGLDDGPAELVVNFLGLAGGSGPLPNPFVELIIERESRRDTAFRDFLDIFNNRLVALMYRIRKIHQLGFEIKSPEQTRTAQYLYSFMGIGNKGLQGRMKVRDRALLYYCGLVAQRPHSMAGLQRMLSHFFRVPIRGVELCGRYHLLEQDQVTRIGLGGQNQVLGESVVLGTRVWDQQTKFRLIAGPLSFPVFQEFLPIGARYLPLTELARFYVGREMDFEINLVLKAREVPESRLSRLTGPRLGWTSWLKTRDFPADDAQVVLNG